MPFMHVCMCGVFTYLYMSLSIHSLCVCMAVAPAYASLYILKRMNIHENQQAYKLAYGNDDDNDCSIITQGYESCIIVIMANEMKSSYSLNSFKLFIVV